MIRIRTRKHKPFKKGEKAINLSTLPVKSFHAMGLDLFQGAKWYHIHGQKRSDDEQHVSLLRKMTSGNKLSFGDLGKYKLLSDNDTDFEFAPLLVSTNRERFDLCEIQAKRFAEKNGTHVIRWPLDIPEWKGRPLDHETARKEDPLFWQYFVPKAPAFCTKNINVSKGIANGTGLFGHSLTPMDTNQAAQISNFCSSHPPGSVLSLNEAPHSANFEVVGVDQELLKTCSMGTGSVQGGPVVPFIFESKHAKYEWYTVRGGSPCTYRPSKAKVRSHFPFDLSFAMTVYKSQGRTMDKLTLVLSERPGISQLTWSAIYVALSRVRKRDDIRFLVHDPHNRKSMMYVTELMPKHDVELYFNGFPSKCGDKWIAERSYESS